MICDSNILIYPADIDDKHCGAFAEREDACIASVTRIEVLGYPGFSKLSEDRRARLNKIVASMVEIELDERVIRQAIALRQQRRISVADAIIAASALVRELPLVTRNEEDFKGIPNLRIINPFASGR